jgi:chromosome segregation ATPase
MERERAETRGRLLELEREAARRPLVAAAVEGSESARRTLESERESLRAEVSALRSRAEQAESRAARLAQERDEALGTNLELQSQKRDLGAKLESGLHRSAEQLQQLEALQSELVRAQEAVGTLDRQRAQERARAELAEAALAECAERLAPALGAAAEAEPPQPAAAGAGAAGGVPAQ